MNVTKIILVFFFKKSLLNESKPTNQVILIRLMPALLINLTDSANLLGIYLSNGRTISRPVPAFLVLKMKLSEAHKLCDEKNKITTFRGGRIILRTEKQKPGVF